MTAYEMSISVWCSDVCASELRGDLDLLHVRARRQVDAEPRLDLGLLVLRRAYEFDPHEGIVAVQRSLHRLQAVAPVHVSADHRCLPIALSASAGAAGGSR